MINDLVVAVFMEEAMDVLSTEAWSQYATMSLEMMQDATGDGQRMLAECTSNLPAWWDLQVEVL